MSTAPPAPVPPEPGAATLAAWLELAREEARLGLWSFDPGTGLVHCDAAACALWQLAARPVALPLAELGARLAPADRLAWEAGLRAPQPNTQALRCALAHPDAPPRRLVLRWRQAPGAAGQPIVGTVAEEGSVGAAVPADSAASQLALAAGLDHIATWRHDFATDRIHYSDEAWRVLDIAPRPEGLALAEVRALIHPDDLARVQASAAAALACDGPTDMEARYRRANGRWRDVMTRRVVQRDATGKPIAFIGVALDVTERIEQQRRAEDATRRFDQLTRAAGIGYWTLDGAAERAYWNDALRAMSGLADDEPVPTFGEWLRRDVHPGDREQVRRRFAEWTASDADSLDQVLRVQRRDGSLRQVICYARVESRHPSRLVYGVVIDVTDRHEVERALRGARERAALAARGAGIGTWELDLRDGSAFWDEQMWMLRGHPPQPVAMKHEQRMACVHPDDRARVASQRHQSQPAGTVLEYEFRVIWPDGQVRWLASRSTEIGDEPGGAARRIGVNWDITDRRNAEGVRREHELTLRESRAKSAFLARMSHELRTPLNAVLGFSQLLLAQEHGNDEAVVQRRRRLTHVRAAGQHLLALIDGVLEVARVDGSGTPIVLQRVALAPLVSEVVALLAPQAQARGIDVQAGELAHGVRADPARLRQVLVNLLGNAVKHNRDHGRVRIDARADAGEVVLQISDSGRGMSEAQLQRLLEPAQRPDVDVDADADTGQGIGLTIVKALVERMGGTLRVRSEVGGGSEFALHLQAADASAAAVEGVAAGAPSVPNGSAAAPATPAAPAAPAGTGRRHRLLYIEDNAVNALIIRELVGRRGDIELTVATDGASGVAQARALQPALILLDMQLPDADGLGVLARLRADATTQAIPVIALSANAMPDDIQRALDAGMADYWTKPLDFRVFMANLDRLLGHA